MEFVTADDVRHLCELSNDNACIYVPFTMEEMHVFNSICMDVDKVPVEELLSSMRVIDFCSQKVYDKVVNLVCTLPVHKLEKHILEQIVNLHSLPRDISGLLEACFHNSSNTREFLNTFVSRFRPGRHTILHHINTLSKIVPPGIAFSSLLRLYGSREQIRDFFSEFMQQFDDFLRNNLLTLYDIDVILRSSQMYDCPSDTLEHLKLLAETLSVPYSYIHKECAPYHLGVAQIMEYKDQYTINTPMGVVHISFDHQDGISGRVLLKRKFKGTVHMNFVVSEIDYIESVILDSKTCHFSTQTFFMPDFIYIYGTRFVEDHAYNV